MAINFNPAALDAFRNAQLTGENAIANLQHSSEGTGGIRQAGSYKGAFAAMFRTGTERAENNAVRTELLRSLGQAFGLEGMSEKDGKVTFSKKFMDKLEQILGKEFKRDDFGINADGTVSSGKPLTQRRITAILDRAKIAGKTEFDLGLYEKKLADIKAKIAQMPDGTKKDDVRDHFADVEKVIAFLKTEIDSFITMNPTYDYYANDLKDFKEIEEKGIKPWDMKNAITGEKINLGETEVGPIIDYLQKNSPGQLFHLELNATRPELVTSYIRHEMESFVKLSIDIFNDSIQADKFDAYAAHLSKPGACMEAKTKNLIDFQEKHGLKESEPVSVAGPTIALDRVAKHDKNTILSDCIFQEIDAVDALNKAKGVDEFSTWEQYEKPIKDSLIGLERPLVTAAKNKDGVWEFTPVLDENNQPIVKKLTSEDIDKIGPACVEFVTEY